MANRTKRTDRARKEFLGELAKTANVTESCRVAGISRTMAYEWRDDDEEFAKDWDDAVEEATDALEAEARRRAVEGFDKPVYQGGKKVGKIRMYSDRLLELLLKAHRSDKFRERVDQHVTGDVTVVRKVYGGGEDDA